MLGRVYGSASGSLEPLSLSLFFFSSLEAFLFFRVGARATVSTFIIGN